jgi:hypothetical protein
MISGCTTAARPQSGAENADNPLAATRYNLPAVPVGVRPAARPWESAAMSWMCPHDDKGRCTRRAAACEIGRAGCVLEGQITPPPWATPADKPAESAMTEVLRGQTLDAMKAYFGPDSRRIDHALKVLKFAETIAADEPGCRIVIVAAAILHDIGIPEAERKHGSAAGPHQEREGPPIARAIMAGLGYDEPTVDHVCRIIANHHSARDIDTPEFRIVWDADWLVNIPEEYPHAARSRLEELIARVFKTPAGRRLAETRFLGL